ncbi:MAG: hypothetical protein KGL39_46845 [Patescibacteria group bacterium]|nr:hypothetical protein [Patescibacteria group bacterium]
MALPITVIPRERRVPGECPYCGQALLTDRYGLLCPKGDAHPFNYRPIPRPAWPEWSRLHGGAMGGGSSKSRQKSSITQKADAAMRRALPGQNARAAIVGDTSSKTLDKTSEGVYSHLNVT